MKMMTMELKVLEQVQKLTWNFEEVKKELTSHIEKYADLVVSETNLAEMEKTQKEIAGLRIRLQKFRLEVKKDFEKPFETFEQQIKALASLIESAEKPIKDQLEKYKDKRKDLKRAECNGLIISVATELGLEDKYRNQIIIDEKWINRGSKIKAIKEEIQMRAVYFLDQQKADKEAETFKQQKIEMAGFMIESLSKGLATPLAFADIENKIDALNIGELRTYIENQVATRKEREERAAQQALEREEQKRIAEIARQEREEQARIERERQRAEFERNEAVIRKGQAEYIEQLAKEHNEPPAPVIVEPIKLYNAQFVMYDVTLEQIELIKDYIELNGFNFKHAVKEA
jgi:hypothetical protein